MEVTFATTADYEQLARLDNHVTPAVVARKLDQGEVLVARKGGQVLGWLRYGFFWDELPMMNMLFVVEELRGRGIGTALVTEWEKRLRAAGHTLVLTSTLASERGQFLYRKLGYVDCGALLLPGEPLEIILRKAL